jgi:predicted nucleic acid-binding protein
MILTKKIFIDETAWYAIIDSNTVNHSSITEKFNLALEEGTKFFTSNISVGNTINRIKDNLNFDSSLKFNEIVEDAHTGNYLRVMWIGRRTQKDAIRLMRKHSKISLQLYDFANAVLMERRGINSILSDRVEFKKLGYRVLPETNDQ